MYQREFAAWRRIGSAPRAAVAAADLYALTHDSAYLDAARQAAVATPRSWIARRLAAI
jgi:hypothetical protein